MSTSRWVEDKHYAYADPHSRRTLFWRCRAASVSEPGRKTFWYVVPDPAAPGRYVAGTKQDPGPIAAQCLYMLDPLRRAVSPRSGGGVVLLTEGEKDALAGKRMGGVSAAASHHGGACKFTPAQAEHLAPLATRAGRRNGPRVLIVVDRDDPGYADGLHRWDLLRQLGLRPDQLAVVRPADGVVSGGSVCVGSCYCDPVCPPPSRGWEKADLTDHVAAGRLLRELTPVPEPDLRAAAERWAVLQQQGASYGASPGGLDALSPVERAWVTNSPWRNGQAQWTRPG